MRTSRRFLALTAMLAFASTFSTTARGGASTFPSLAAAQQSVAPLAPLRPVALDDPPGFAAPFVPPAPAGRATRFVAPNGSDSNPGTSALPWRQIAHAAAQAQPGDVIDIADGVYSSPIEIDVQGTAALPVVFRAVGANAIVSGAGTNSTDRDAIFITFAEHVVVHGLKIQNAYRSGVRVDQADHVTIQACVCSNNGRWGIFTDFADDLRLIGNECYGSVLEHGIYHSNSGDRALIRGNWCHDNWSSGIQINADPSQGDDGISSECVVERNLLVRNGLGTGMGGGGAAINLASVRDCVIRNNVLISNRATGIALWDDGQGSQWGSKNNLIAHNTVVFEPTQGRFAVLFWNGSTNNVLKDNVLVGGARGAITFTADSLPGLDSDHNVLRSLSGWPIVVNDLSGQTYNLAAWQALGHDAHSSGGAPVFTNAAGGDWSLAPGSVGRDAGIDLGIARDYQGSPRPRGAGFDVGAYER